MTANTKKALTGVGVAFALFYVLTQPSGSADVTRDGLGQLENGGDQLVTFMEELTQ